MSFRLSAKHLSLTYSQANNITAQDVIEVIEKSGKLEYYIVGTELHKDGGTHYHVYANYASKRNIKNARHFDCKGIHPNFKATINIAAWKTYCKMDGNYIEWPTEQDSNDNIIDHCRSMQEAEFLQWCHQNKVQAGYYHEAKRICRETPFTIEDVGEGNDLYPPNQEQSILYSNWWHQNRLEQLLSGNQWSSQASPEQEKHHSLLSTVPSQRCLSPTLISSTSSDADTTKASSSMTLASRTFQERAKSIWSIGTLPEPYTFDIGPLTYQQESKSGSPTTTGHLAQEDLTLNLEQLKEE